MKRGIFLLLLLLSINLFGQKEYSNWYFGEYAGLSFNSGSPIAITTSNCNSFSGSATINDSLGNLLFYTDGEKVYNKYNYYTPNGTGLYGKGSTQGTIILQKPGSNNIYYIINAFYSTMNIPAIPAQGLFYSIFNMELDGGLGDIDPSQKNVPIYLPLSGYACDKLTAIKHKNNKDIWIITRSFPGNKFYSFLLTSSGISNIGQISPSLIDLNTWQQTYGEIAISPDGKRMAAAYSDKRKFEFGSFNIETGKFNPEFVIQPDTNSNGAGFPEPYGLEFSPDSKLLYYCMAPHPLELFYFAKIQQYDALSPDSAFFKQSEITIGYGISGTLQTGLDGKIYGGLMHQTNISVIDSPNKRGNSCNFQYEAISLANKKYWTSLPQMIQKYFAYFNVQHPCANQPVEFTSNIWPLPDSVYWNFGDAASGSLDTSGFINTSHVYNSPGNYQVTLIAYWPGDRADTTIKNITVGQPPDPALGGDKQICIGGSTTLSSAAFDSYLWITGDTTQSIPVADTGTYWVQVINQDGCIGRDSVRVDYYAPPVLNTDSLVISPTTCGGSRGAITGLTATGVELVSVEWRDGYNNLITAGYDLVNMPVGNYNLWSMDGNGCTNLLGQYYIRDAGDVLIDTVKSTPSYCGSDNGTITISALSGLGEKLQYSIDDGNHWSNDSIFSSLSPSIPYLIRVSVIDTTGCQAVFEFNPVILADLPGPSVSATSQPETDNNADGFITITASGFGTLTYILENGIPQDSGVFTGLQSGMYHYRVEDQSGCFVQDSIRVDHLQGFVLSAIAGNDTICRTQTLHIPVMVDNFNGIRSFNVVMNYEAQKVTCQGFMPGSMNNQLPGMEIEDFPAIQEIVATWTGSIVTLQGGEQLFTLVFTPNETGISDLTWDQAPGKSYFEGESGLIDNVQLVPGQMQVNEPTDVSIGYEPKACEGDMLIIAPVFTGTTPLTYSWQKPDGGSETGEMIFDPFAGEEDSGDYQIKVTDALGCSDLLVINARVIPPPAANFPDTPIPFEQEYRLEAPQGYASYQWSTGDSIYYITVTEEGVYSVTIQTEEGCESTDTAMMVNVAVPIQVPNAFTPNGDGLNDVFRPVVDGDRVRQFSMVIYDKWGQRVFETTDPVSGWNGQNAPPDIYGWVITYTDLTGKVNKLRGSITLVQ